MIFSIPSNIKPWRGSAACHLLLLFMMTCWFTGCGKKGAPPPAMSLQEAPANLQKAFESAQPEVKKGAEEVAVAIQEQNDVKSFVSLQDLSARPDLSQEQRTAAAQAMIALNARLREAASKGDKRAEDMLNTYRAKK